MNAANPALFANLQAYWGGYDRRVSTPTAPGVVAYASGLSHPLFNGVLSARLDPSALPATAGRLREQFAALGLPATWWVGPDSEPADLGERLAALGFPQVDAAELMAIDLASLPDEAPPVGLEVRPVEEPDEVRAWAGVVTEVFHVSGPAGPAYAALEAANPATERYARFGGWADGRLVATAALTTDAGVAGIYAVATLAAYERRGYGRALTLAALREGRRRGLAVGTLQATRAGHPVYRRLGFVDLGTFRLHALAG
ncbi:MAG TPA: GNAT family N-acetyltransferase [Polyangiaceae bacterium]|nr:GNAT family N-acetyltransferase [Polyangiaceae bacterium]